MQKTAYEMRISDWSADVCSSDLDPSQDPDVSALSDAQAESTRQFARTQIDNFMRRAEALHNGGGSAGAGMGLQFAFRDMPAMARQIGRANVELQSLMRKSYAVFCLK